MRIRPAGMDELPALSALALRAKASWGYPPAFLEACRDELTLTPEKVAGWDIWVAELDGRPAGMIALRMAGLDAELEDFFVEPELQARGVGSALMSTFLDAARARGAIAVALDADPHAEPIYARFGFTTVGRSPSGSIPGRWLPRMRMRL
ncbi:GNAT family N-acetyltransferase [Phenylobacterium sp.]|jgi:GNAT superfamily N-acetyltransferase|uniref:GNAT family N-acetyltransferase n=1 Tax=Phenylobacterium sp. TaxID=1871053 RepID=UPI002F93FEE1